MFLSFFSFLLSLFFLASLSGCSAPVKSVPPAPFDTASPGVVYTRVAGAFSLSVDRDLPVFVEAVDGPLLASFVRSLLAAQGFSLADSRESAAVVYVVDGAFQAYRPATHRFAEARLGVYFSSPSPLPTRSGKGPIFSVGHNFLATGLSTLFSSVGSSLGLRDAFNTSAVGDPDGQCVSDCERWLYQQRAVSLLTRSVAGRSETVSVLAWSLTADPDPSALFRASLDGLFASVGLSSSPALSSFLSPGVSDVAD